MQLISAMVMPATPSGGPGGNALAMAQSPKTVDPVNPG